MKYFRGLLWVVGVLVAIVAILRATVLNFWTVPDNAALAAAVAPTLNAGDFVILLTRGTPTFGDLVRCVDPEDPQQFIVGRIAGLSGDVVETHGRNLTVNSKHYDAQSACTPKTFIVNHPNTQSEVELNCDVVAMGGGWHYRGSSPASKEPKSTREVGAGMLFLLSDDREYHDDSRDFGPIAAAACTERIVFRLWGAEGWSDEGKRLSYIR